MMKTMAFLLLLAAAACAGFSLSDMSLESARASLSFDVIDVGAPEARATCAVGACRYPDIDVPRCDKYGFKRSSCFGGETSSTVVKDGCYCCLKLSGN